MTKKHSSSGLTDEQRQFIKGFAPNPAREYRKPIDGRDITNAILYVLSTGCPWRVLTTNFPGGRAYTMCFVSGGGEVSGRPSTRDSENWCPKQRGNREP
ncbi:MAG: transposase [Thermogutta sp.]